MRHAEVREVWPREGQIRIVGDVVGEGAGTDCDGPGRWSLVLAAKQKGGKPAVRRLATRILRGPAVRRYPAEVHDGEFEVRFPVQPLVAFPQWDVYLDCGESRLRLGRHLDDIGDLRSVFRFPGQKALPTRRMALLRPRRGLGLRARFKRGIRIKPQYTSDNHLVIGRPTAAG